MPSVEFKSISKKYKKLPVIKDLSFTAPADRITVILGPSGAGKTTVLRLIAGLERPESGELYFNDRLVSSRKNILEPRKRKIGIVFQDLALWPHWTNLQNIMFVINNRNRNTRKEKACKLLEMVHLKDKATKYPSELSGGEKQRIAIVRALASDPEILLLDEPFSNLEKSLRERLLEEFKLLISSRNITVIYVTHNQEEGFSIAEKVIILKDGTLHQEGDKEDVFFNPKDRFTAEFLGYRTFLPAPLTEKGFIQEYPAVNGKCFCYRSADICVQDTEKGSWQIVDSMFRNGSWISRLSLEDDIIYACTEKQLSRETKVKITIKRPPAIIDD